MLILENAKRFVCAMFDPFKPAANVEIELVDHLHLLKFDAVDVPVKKQLLPLYLQRPFPLDILVFMLDAYHANGIILAQSLASAANGIEKQLLLWVIVKQPHFLGCPIVHAERIRNNAFRIILGEGISVNQAAHGFNIKPIEPTFFEGFQQLLTEEMFVVGIIKIYGVLDFHYYVREK